MKMMHRRILLAGMVISLFGCDADSGSGPNSGEKTTNSATNKAPDKKEVGGRWYTQARVDAGAIIFENNCAECHGKEAQGLAADWRKTLPDGSYPPPPLNGSAHAWHHPLRALKRTVDFGGIKFGGKMQGFKGKLSDDEQVNAIAFFQSKWSDKIYDAWIQRGGLE